jgi:hypothetical protein
MLHCVVYITNKNILYKLFVDKRALWLSYLLCYKLKLSFVIVKLVI